jgi:hypothetical protein
MKLTKPGKIRNFAAYPQRWADEPVTRTGTRARFQWVETTSTVVSLAEIITRLHSGLRLAIVAFDCGPIQPTTEEERDGWSTHGTVMLSPPLRPDLDIPWAECDEWYVFEDEPRSDWHPEIFVNNLGFTVAPIEELQRHRDPTWDGRGLDWLKPLQELFWSQIETVNAVTYVAIGNLLVVVSRVPAVVEAVAKAAQQAAEADR